VLEQQALCPFQAFAATRLSATPMPAVSPGLLASERGSLMHRALYQLWGALGDSDSLAKLDVSGLNALLEAALDYAERGLSRERMDVLDSALLTLERQRLKQLLTRWIAIEAQRPEAFVVSERETQREHDLAGLRMRLRLDRVDRLGDGSALILDYKSAAPESLNRWMEERPTRPQLPLYALLEPPAGGIAFASLKPGKMGFRGIGERSFAEGIEPASQWGATTEAEPLTMAGLRSAWQAQLSALASEFLAGESAVNPTIDACRYCQRQSLCRLGEERV
jgi:RecB family exonuclease